ncbi:hypothetical protein M407DRAFT_20526 [Tulasnella calospora MUT 4182]|uniref:Clathrin/coatomer adaptor adaptin-like N-terminal domain-containing protein n=1 Tax=Tulasnella calospora MUT 4182 TaxID=1051891 RepID=A0A0C3QRM6_9AGAM|nr:hypothetical protein M407DRAFT_20526 [Tulasnella calospora MUT 4182]
MEVTFNNSGAINRAHYALVQKIENASSPSLADDAIIQEIDTIRRRFAKAGFTPDSRACREWLLILLHCSMAMTFELPRSDYLEFALPAAVGLAGGGAKLSDRRVGYEFCAAVMPPEHELHLMLVNTFRKDLESRDETHICLALDMLLQVSSSDVVPAIQSRLEDLLSHKSFQVKRRAMATFKTLSRHNPDLLQRTTRKIFKRLRDDVVASSAFSLAAELVKAGMISGIEVGHAAVEVIQKDRSNSQGRRIHSPAVAAIRCVGQLIVIDPNSGEVKSLAEVLIQKCLTSSKSSKIVLECFRALSVTPEPILMMVLSPSSDLQHPVSGIHYMLMSKDPNLHYTFLACLLAIDVKLWVGVDEAIPAQLQENEVHRIMSFLDGSDLTIRRMTIQLLYRVDPAILEAWFSRFIESTPSPTSTTLATCEVYASRALEVSTVLDAENGEAFASRLKVVLQAVQVPHKDAAGKDSPRRGRAHDEGSGAGVNAVLESVVEPVLDRLRESTDEFRKTFVEKTLQDLQESFTGVAAPVPTATVICAAVACEYSQLVTLPPSTVAEGLTNCLATSPGVQEALLIALTKVVAMFDDESSPVAVVTRVEELLKQSRKHMRHRCDQFLRLVKDKAMLKTVVQNAKSQTLPDILLAIEEQFRKLPKPVTSPSSASSRAVSPRGAAGPSALRYDAYDAPGASRRKSQDRHQVRTRRPSQTPSTRSSAAYSEEFQRSPILNGEDPLAQTITPAGLVALAEGDEGLRNFAVGNHIQPGGPSIVSEALASKVDLITLESPFHAEPPTGIAEALKNDIQADPSSGISEESFLQSFDVSWNSIKSTTRGWSESPPATVAGTLQDAGLGFIMAFPSIEAGIKAKDQTFHDNEILGMLLTSDGQISAAIRLRPGEDDSSLWILKCDTLELKSLIKNALQGDG